MEYEQLKQALQDYFGDTSRSPGATKAGLQALIDEAESMIESIPDKAEED